MAFFIDGFGLIKLMPVKYIVTEKNDALSYWSLEDNQSIRIVMHSLSINNNSPGIHYIVEDTMRSVGIAVIRIFVQKCLRK